VEQGEVFVEGALLTLEAEAELDQELLEEAFRTRERYRKLHREA